MQPTCAVHKRICSLFVHATSLLTSQRDAMNRPIQAVSGLTTTTLQQVGSLSLSAPILALVLRVLFGRDLGMTSSLCYLRL